MRSNGPFPKQPEEWHLKHTQVSPLGAVASQQAHDHAVSCPDGVLAILVLDLRCLSTENRACSLAELRFLLIETHACDDLRHPSSRGLPCLPT